MNVYTYKMDIDIDFIRNKLYHLMIEELKSKLTIGRIEDGFAPFTEQGITQFVDTCADEIEKTIDEMIEAYEQDGDIADLVHCEANWVQEFLYENIDLPLM